MLPKSLQVQATKLIHNLSHLGMSQGERLLRDYFWFPSYSISIRAEVEKCDICKHVTLDTRKEPLGFRPVPSHPMEQVAMDFKGPFKSDGRYCLVMFDLYSRWPEIYFTHSTSFKANKKHFLNWIAHWGCSRIWRSDGGPPFFGIQFSNFTTRWGIKHLQIIPEQPQNNADCESFMRLLSKTYEIARLTGQDYEELMRTMLLAKRSTPHPAINMSPHEALTGWKLNPGLFKGRQPLDPKVGLPVERQLQLQKDLIASKVHTKLEHDKKRNVYPLVLRKGDLVLVRLGNNKLPQKETYQVIKVSGKMVMAVGVETGHAIKRHISRFIKVMAQAPEIKHDPDVLDDIANYQDDADENPSPHPQHIDDDLDDDPEIRDQQNQPPELGQPPVQDPIQPHQVRQHLQNPQVQHPRRITFDNNVRVREVDRNHNRDHIGRNSTRSSGIPPIELPRIQPSLLEHRLSNYHHDARESIEQHRRDHDRTDQPDQPGQ